MSEALPIFAVMRLVRDARSVRDADRQLLDALVLRCNPARRYSCFPSYRRLALDTALSEGTLQRAAKRLEDKGLVKRVVRSNRSNLFFVNVRLLQDQAAAVKADEDAAKIGADTDQYSPFLAPTIADSEPSDTTEDEDADWVTGGGR